VDWGLVIFFLFSAFRTIGSPTEVRRTGQSGQSDDFLLQGDFTRLSPDLDRTSSGIWSSPTDSVGSPTDPADSPSELAGSGESPLESVGKGGGV
jgi:hypothetical protein